MKALIQHNFSSGLGDCIVAVYEYLETLETLKNLGYDVELILNIRNNVYLYNENFFDLFNEEVFNHFSKVTIVDTPISQIVYEDLTRVYTLGNASPGQHWWDLYISDPENFKYELLSIYPYQESKTPKDIKIFNENIYEEYRNIKIKYNLNTPFNSIYFRTYDYVDNSKLYLKYETLISELIVNNDKIFLCSNSFKLKDKIKKLGDGKIISYNIPYENEIGNHWTGRKPVMSQNELFERTKFTIFDMLTLSDSLNITHISEWGRTSNFLIFSKINKIQIIPCYDY